MLSFDISGVDFTLEQNIPFSNMSGTQYLFFLNYGMVFVFTHIGIIFKNKYNLKTFDKYFTVIKLTYFGALDSQS